MKSINNEGIYHEMIGTFLIIEHSSDFITYFTQNISFFYTCIIYHHWTTIKEENFLEGGNTKKSHLTLKLEISNEPWNWFTIVPSLSYHPGWPSLMNLRAPQSIFFDKANEIKVCFSDGRCQSFHFAGEILQKLHTRWR